MEPSLILVARAGGRARTRKLLIAAKQKNNLKVLSDRMDLSRSVETQITALTDQNKPDEQDSCVGGPIAIVTIAFLGVYFSFRSYRGARV